MPAFPPTLLDNFAKHLLDLFPLEEVRQATQGSSRQPDLPLLAWANKYLASAFSDPPSRFHLWLAEELDGLRQKRGQRLSVQAPRGSAKSSWASYAYPLREALEGREPFIVIASDTSGQAQTFLRQIRSAIEDNELIRRDYPHSSGKGPIWRDSHIRLRNGVEVLALGTGGKVRGRKTAGNRRPTLCLIDDPQNKDHIVSPLQRERSWEWLTKDMLSSGEPTTNYVVLGTALHRDCIVCRLASTPGWRSQVFRSIITWPVRLDLWAEWEQQLHDYDNPDREQAARAFYEANKELMHL